MTKMVIATQSLDPESMIFNEDWIPAFEIVSQ